jgi:membrane protease YdiL (CAAX protease family)
VGSPEPRRVGHYLDWSDRGRSGFLRYLVGAALVLAISLVIGQTFAVVGKLVVSSESAIATIVKTTFFGFILSFLLLPLVPRIVNRRPWWSIAMPRPVLDWRNLLIGAGAAVGAQVTLQAVAFALNPDAYTYSDPNLTAWLGSLVVAAAAFFVQASTEEMTYRGYLTQFARRFLRHPVGFLLMPAVVFAAPHYGNVEGLTGPLALLPYMILGLCYGWLAYRSGSLWMAAGAHMGSNWFITGFVGSSEEKIEKISLFITSGGATHPWRLTLSTAALALLIVGVSELVMRRTGRIVGLSASESESDMTAVPSE